MGWAQQPILCEKPKMLDIKLNIFLAGPPLQAIQIQCLFLPQMGIKDCWAHQNFQKAHQSLKRPIKILNFTCI